ncbi:MAG: TRAP transporter large permease subunit [Betaproteobacteria bacterium]|nr:TRAP transporter large permease subunit [Betaproteobacteria bacterium]MBM3465971.1 TRAP transporter large permease subunit [Armatimonadota bacterium]
MEWISTHLSLILFFVLTLLLFMGFPVAFALGGVAIIFGAIGMLLDVFMPVQFFNLLPRIWGSAASNPILVAVPMFIFMGTVLERSGVANDLLHCLQVILRRVPGGLAISVTLMGTIMAATTGIVGASVVMLTLIALPAMMERGYQKELAVGTIASAGTLGILIPPSIMLVIMGDLLSVSVGSLFAGAVIPGLLLSFLYLAYIAGLSFLKPQYAPPLPKDMGPKTSAEFWTMIFKSFLPPTFLIVLVLGSIFGGWATPTEAAGVGSFGALLLAWGNKRLNKKSLKETIESSALTNGMVFFIFFGATMFSFVFRSLGGDELVMELLEKAGLNTGWEILIFMMVLTFVLGFFFDWLEICLIVLPIFAPVLKGVDFGPHLGDGGPIVFITWLILMLSVNLQTSFLTPPFGFTLFYMKGTVPPSITMKHIYRGIIPFVILQLIGLLLVIMFPELALWLPRKAGFLS